SDVHRFGIASRRLSGEPMPTPDVPMIIAVITVLLFLWRLLPRLRSLRGLAFTPSLSRHLSHWVKAVDYSKEEFFAADDAAAPWIDARRRAFDALVAELEKKSPLSAEWVRRFVATCRICA